MFSLDTLVFCDTGLKTVGELTLDDKIITPSGKFTNILSIIDENSQKSVVTLSTDEELLCSKDTKLSIYDLDDDKHTEFIKNVEDLQNMTASTTKTLPIINENDDYEGIYYKIGTKMPRKITDEMLLMPWRDRMDLMVGILDTPFVVLASETGIYEMLANSYEMEQRLIVLFRSFGYPVYCRIRDKKHYIKMGVQNLKVIHDIKFRDKYKEFSVKPPDNRYRFMEIKDVCFENDVIPMRKIVTEDDFYLIGYSMIPVYCVK